MKYIIALAIFVLAMAAMAKTENDIEITSVKSCKELAPHTKHCERCCRTFNLENWEGRWLHNMPGLALYCKCVTAEKYKQIQELEYIKYAASLS